MYIITIRYIKIIHKDFTMPEAQLRIGRISRSSFSK